MNKRLPKLKSLIVFTLLFVLCMGMNKAIAQPSITALSVNKGVKGAIVIITGSGFNTTTANDIVYFGATRAAVLLASTTSLTVTVPIEATYYPVTVTNTFNGLTGYSDYSFLPFFHGHDTVLMDPKIDSAAVTPLSTAIGDIDGDGKADVVVANYADGSIYIYRNTGVIDTIRFAAHLALTVGTNPYRVALGDLDGDGKLDIAMSNSGSNTISVFLNTSTPGAISFATQQTFAINSPNGIAIADIDNDGRADIVTTDVADNVVAVFLNTGSVGAISFAPHVDFATGVYPLSVAAGDLDGDGKYDLAVANYNDNSISVLQNTSIPGTVNFTAHVDYGGLNGPYDIAIGDLNGDGKGDIAVTNELGTTVTIFRNTSILGTISLAANLDFAAGNNPLGVAFGDMNGDGKTDIIVSNYSANTVSVLRNTSTLLALSFHSPLAFGTGANPYFLAVGDLDGDGKADIAVPNSSDNTVSFLRNSDTAYIVVPVFSLVSADTQCFTGNLFSFTTVDSDHVITAISWDFGDTTTSALFSPTHHYTTVGTYIVKVYFTINGITDSATMNVLVRPSPNADFTRNDTLEYLSSNTFIFKGLDSTAGNTYLYLLGDSSTSPTRDVNHLYHHAGTFHVTHIVTNIYGCTDTVSHDVVVASDSVGSGSGGGLESQSLGGLVSRRDYTNFKNSVSCKVNYSTLPQFTPATTNNNLARTTTSSTNGIRRFIPSALAGTDNTYQTTPEDITSITSAVDVFSVDYTAGNQAKAVVLGITTLNKAYSHTKSICDRFRGATLLDTKEVTIKGIKFIQFTLQQANGTVEYAIAFAAGRSAGTNSFKVQSKWLISQYAGDDTVFNFQAWAAIPSYTQTLVGNILDNLGATMSYRQTDTAFGVPKAYITYGKRNKGNLNMAFNNTTDVTGANLAFDERVNENAGIDNLNNILTLNPGLKNTLSLPIKDGYEYEGHLYLNGQLTDEVYMADGNYSLDVDKNYTTVSQYAPGNSPARVYYDNEYPLYRNVSVKASSTDYLSLYKFIAPGDEKVNLTDYHSFKFYAKGSGQMEIKLLKDGITNWKDQYKTVVTLDPAGKNYIISLDDFASDKLTAPFTANDIKAVVYTFLFNHAPTDLNYYVDNQAFSKEVAVSTNQLNAKSISIYPNPSTGSFQCKFISDDNRALELQVMDITGRVVYTQAVNATVGANTVQITLPDANTHSILMVGLSNGDVTYKPAKMTILQ
ncbi:MAG: VCBS repeat-containing protein [Taibaiella sp.]|nr:VCBS repeat-containing protein [Taibaiella sp.]